MVFPSEFPVILVCIGLACTLVCNAYKICKTHTTCSTKHKLNQNQSRLAPTQFPVIMAQKSMTDCFITLSPYVVIASAPVIALVLFLRRSIGNRWGFK